MEKIRKSDLQILRSEHRLRRFKEIGVARLIEREEKILERLKVALAFRGE